MRRFSTRVWLALASVVAVLGGGVVAVGGAGAGTSQTGSSEANSGRLMAADPSARLMTRHNRTRAAALADQLLSTTVLPSDARRVDGLPKAAGDLLDHPDTEFLIASQVDHHRFWRTAASPLAVLASIRAHLLHGVKIVNPGYAGSEQLETLAFPISEPHSLGARQVVVSALGLNQGGTVVRLDAEVRYIAPRPAGQRIPATARVLQITVGSNLKHPLRSVTVSRQAPVRRIAEMVDQLPFIGNERGLAFSCPAFSTKFPVDRFIFAASPGGPALATVSELAATPTVDSGCTSTSLTIRDQRQRPLQDGGVLLKDAGKLLQVRLSR